ncbi:Protein geranylgeranyltransferase/Protein farnesyltransferase [Giardia muris]|uniref:Geranylgeranyl transferase type-2 subunit alpha n=1 Tax=Giardia muris TaxID=5742 RepID=A0A4Z1SU89_GIAMU|nr:Protein geranylgeranyltransferase/Protein farnesyltransferase [Giardia muris]|eukprot:TNJ27178.1 Protein geranylgeranyltransferase/Protein farnesyltransferase [Giardia muris]
MLHNVSTRKEDREKVLELQEKERRCLQLWATRTFDEEADRLTLEVLTLNPFISTVWMHRRGILGGHKGTEEELSSLVRELHITTRALEYNAKIYSVWDHRRFVIETLIGLGDDGYKKQLLHEERTFVLATLRRDSRNFHAWNHLRLLNIDMGLDTLYQLLDEDFTNHSALHQLYLELSKDLAPNLHRALTFVRNCLMLSPDTESLWQFLLKLSKNLPDFPTLVEEILHDLEEDGCTFTCTDGMHDSYVRPPAMCLLLAAKDLLSLDSERLDQYVRLCTARDGMRTGLYRLLFHRITTSRDH